MKLIKSVPLWNGDAQVLNTTAINVELGSYAMFWYGLFTLVDGNVGVQVGSGNVTMNGDEYTKLGSNDSYAWDFVAKSLNLTIIGDYVPPVPEPIVETPIVETPSEEIISE